MTLLSRVLLAFALALLAPLSVAQQAFTVKDIRVEGLQRISAGTVFNYLPIKVGDEIAPADTATAIRALFKTGFFKDVRIESEGGTLVVVVTERPSIDNIEFSGNHEIETEQLTEALTQTGFTTGRVFDRSLFERTKIALREAYFSRGRYAVKIQETITPLPRNRVGVNFDISEGRVAKIKRINVVGNAAFDEDDMLDLFQLTTPTWLSWFDDSDQYSKQKLGADLETLRSYYLDRGYINFNVDSTQVSITPDKRHVYITINVDEGEQFTVRSVKLAGELVVDKEELFPLVTVTQGGVFSRQEVSETASKLTDRLGDEGYAFANVNAVPEIAQAEKEVDLTFFTDPGKRVYVRRVEFRGNTKSRDRVLRREMRQVEGGWISTGQLERSRVRLQRLGYFEEVNIETPAVAGTTDQVDVIVTVVEKPSGSFVAGAGFSQSQGFVINTSINQENFLGTGNRISVTFNNSEVNRQFGFSYMNPYWTIDGVSRSFDLFYREVDASNANLANYSTTTVGGGVEFGIPVNEFDAVNIGITADFTDFTAESGASTEVRAFEQQNGDGYFTWRLNSLWARDSRNRRVLPDSGSVTRVTGEVALPGSDLTYYRLGAEHTQFVPLGRYFAFMANGEVNYGDAYGDTDGLPLVNNYFAGGIRSIRGFRANTLGPRDSNSLPLGGAFRVVGKGEIILPVPFVKDTRSIRLTTFVDAGNVFKDINAFETGEMRVSVGLSAIWLSPFGAMTFSVAEPLNDESTDEVENFQFTFGTSF
jgi:outer membrane protein insertion porin family